MFKQVLQEHKFPTGVVITFQVMAFARMSPRHPNRIGAFAQGGQSEFRAHATGAGNAHDPYIGRVLHAADPGQVGGAVAAPVAQKTDDFRFPF
jgi:hypothetical protein